jgi:hypothetical protein
MRSSPAIGRFCDLILQNRLPDVVTPVKAVLQHHHRILISLIKTDIAGIAADIAHLIGDSLPAERIGTQILPLFPWIVINADVGKSLIQRGMMGRRKMSAGIFNQVAGVTDLPRPPCCC